MNKIVLKSLIVMLTLVFGLMVAGCQNEPKEEEEFDPSGGKTVDEKYWGTYHATVEGVGTFIIILSEKKLVYKNSSQTSQNSIQAWTVGNKVYRYWNEEEPSSLWGTFVNSTTLRMESDGSLFEKQ